MANQHFYNIECVYLPFTCANQPPLPPHMQNFANLDCETVETVCKSTDEGACKKLNNFDTRKIKRKWSQDLIRHILAEKARFYERVKECALCRKKNMGLCENGGESGLHYSYALTIFGLVFLIISVVFLISLYFVNSGKTERKKMLGKKGGDVEGGGGNKRRAKKKGLWKRLRLFRRY